MLDRQDNGVRCRVPGIGHGSRELWASWHSCGLKLFFDSDHERRTKAPTQETTKIMKQTVDGFIPLPPCYQSLISLE